MRLPRLFENGKTYVDMEKTFELIRYAAAYDINYFDTAFGYHTKTSETVLAYARNAGNAGKNAGRELKSLCANLPFQHGFFKPYQRRFKHGLRAGNIYSLKSIAFISKYCPAAKP